MQSRILRIILALLIVIPSATSINLATASSCATPILGSAANYSILTTALSNTGASVVSSNVSATAITTFPTQSQGTTNSSGDATYQIAMNDLRNAISRGLSLTGGTPYSTITGATFTPGVYTQTPEYLTSAAASEITLNGAGEYIFQVKGAFTPGANTKFIFLNGATAANVYWIFGKSFTLGAAVSSFEGNLLAQENITFGDSTTLHGRALALMAVNLSTTRIDTPALAPSGPVCSITFTDTTLVGATIGAVYSDSVIAETRIGTLASSAPITYAITSGALPSGLTLNSSSGLVSGTPISLATVGSYTAGVTASSPSYPSQSISYTFQLAAAASSTDKTLSFNDATLAGATIGTVYSDSVTAVAKTGTTTDNGIVITYALSSGSLPSGLILSSSTGLISGTPSTSAPTGAYPVIFLASTTSTGYPPQSLSYTFQLAAASIERTIVFTDTTLYDATVGTFYADYIIAATKIGNNLSSAAVTYFVDPSSLPIGLTLNPLNGLVSGIPSPSTRTGTYYGLISALATEYPTKSQYFAFQLNAAVSTDKTITFTDTTLNDATIGTFYSDYVIAASKIGSGFNGAPITYSVEAGTPLPIGLTLNPLTGLISGTPISSARTGTYTSIIWASSPGYPAQSLNYTFQTYASLTKSSNPSTPLQASFGTPVNTLMMTALFANNSSALTSKNRSAIKTMATKLKTLNVATLTVAGYASANGKSGHLKLSIARAKAVAAVLASSGVKTKISIKGLGIFASTGTQSALALSRKAEIWVLQNS